MPEKKLNNLTLSVVIPVYNAKDIIENTVALIENASRVPDELILIDDGSTDGSSEICDRLAAQYDNVFVSHQINGGIANARNAGIEAASGDYICLVDQDDMPSEKMYEIGMDIAEASAGQRGAAVTALPDGAAGEPANTPVDMIMFSTGRLVKGRRSDYEVFEDATYDNDGVKNVLLPAFLYRGYEEPKRDGSVAISASIWKCMVRRQLFLENKIHFKRFISYEDDYIMMMELLCSAKCIWTCSHRGYYWVINESSESHSGKYIESYGKKLFELNDYLCGCLKEAGLSEEKIKIFSDQLLFEKTIDLIANSFAKDPETEMTPKSVSDAKLGSGKSEIYEYVTSCSFFDLDDSHIRPLPKFRRLKMLNKYKAQRNVEALITGVRRFLKIEGIIHQNPLAKILLHK